MDEKKLPQNNAEDEKMVELGSEQLEQVAGGIYLMPQPVSGIDVPP